MFVTSLICCKISKCCISYISVTCKPDSMSVKQKVDKCFSKEMEAFMLLHKSEWKACVFDCKQAVAVSKEHNAKRHNESYPGVKYDKFTRKLSEDKLSELEQLEKQKWIFTQAPSSDGAVRASSLISPGIAVSPKIFAGGELRNRICANRISEQWGSTNQNYAQDSVTNTWTFSCKWPCSKEVPCIWEQYWQFVRYYSACKRLLLIWIHFMFSYFSL